MKTVLTCLLSCSLALLMPVTLRAQAIVKGLPEPQAKLKAETLASAFQAAEFRDDTGNTLRYRYFKPKPSSDAGRMPVILYLHGEDEAGTDNKSQLVHTECATVWIEPDHLAAHPVYVLAPQLPRGSNWTSAPVYEQTLRLLNQFVKRHPGADTDRIYLVGFSMGATGVYNMLLKNPGLFAAGMPISGSADAYLGQTAAWAALKNTPVIIIHSYDDTDVPVSAALNAAAALQAGGNKFLGYGAPTPSLWSPGSTPVPHDAWYTAFEKFEVIYNSLFLGDLAKTHHGEFDLTSTYTSRKLGNGITQVWDYALGTSLVIERPDKAVIVDATMGHGSIYQYIRDHVLVNKDVPIEIFITHQHEDHTLGLISFIGSPQLKKIYVGVPDNQRVMQLMGPDASKVVAVKDGDTVPLGDSKVEVIAVPGHTAGSIVMKYSNYLFSGDSIGTGYIGVGAFSVEQYIGSVQHLLDRMGPGRYTIYGGHTGELRGVMTDQYVRDLLACVKGIVDGSLPDLVYWRGRELSTRKVTTYGGASITYSLVNVHRNPAALNGLRLSQGTLYPGFSPEFSPLNANTPGFQASTLFYTTWVGKSVASVDIVPSVLDRNYKSLTINGEAANSGEPYPASLAGEKNSFAITVTAADGSTRTYHLTVIRGAP